MNAFISSKQQTLVIPTNISISFALQIRNCIINISQLLRKKTEATSDKYNKRY
jgi:hypothetical protein